MYSNWPLQLFRHGDRSPGRTFPNDLYADYWPQGFGQLSRVMRQYLVRSNLKSTQVYQISLIPKQSGLIASFLGYAE